MSPPLNVRGGQQYSGNIKRFRIDELLQKEASANLNNQAKVEMIRLLVEQERTSDKKTAKAREVLSIARNLRNLNVIVGPRTQFMWQLLHLTGLHTKGIHQSRQQRVVSFGWEFYGDIAFWKWAIDQRIMSRGESLRDPLHTNVLRKPVTH